MALELHVRESSIYITSSSLRTRYCFLILQKPLYLEIKAPYHNSHVRNRLQIVYKSYF